MSKEITPEMRRRLRDQEFAQAVEEREAREDRAAKREADYLRGEDPDLE